MPYKNLIVQDPVDANTFLPQMPECLAEHIYSCNLLLFVNLNFHFSKIIFVDRYSKLEFAQYAGRRRNLFMFQTRLIQLKNGLS